MRNAKVHELGASNDVVVFEKADAHLQWCVSSLVLVFGEREAAMKLLGTGADILASAYDGPTAAHLMRELAERFDAETPKAA